ncbi:MAG TPA: nucleotidyltransferase family protein [Methylibium sp.]|nr:nucleotidyltransferase family protein [Methylibium sp.]
MSASPPSSDAWRAVLIAPEATLRDAMAAIDRGGRQIALVVDADDRLLGTLSDGDVRRGLLRGAGLDSPADAAMNRQPTVARPGETREAIVAAMRARRLHQIPRLDAAGRVVGLELIDELLLPQALPNRVVIMAGGLGTRLAELTRDTPKPMLKVGSRPLLETIVREFVEQGLRRFWIAVNYKAEQIETHFGDGAWLGAEIGYLRETARMGTAGALSLLPERPAESILVTNADLLVKADCRALLAAHEASGALATMAVREHETQVPYGVIETAGEHITGVTEKPTLRHIVSAGLYALAPAALDRVPKGRFFDMPELFAALIAEGRPPRHHRLDGYWLDIGRLPDFERANAEFKDVFG